MSPRTFFNTEGKESVRSQWGSECYSNNSDTTAFLFAVLSFVFCTSHFYKVLANEERRGEERRCTPFPQRERVLAERLNAAGARRWRSTVISQQSCGQMLLPVAWIKLTVSHCPQKATHEYNCRLFFFFIMMENSVFFCFFVFKNTGLVFRVLAALAWDLPVTLLGKLQPNSEAAVRQDWPGWNLLDLPIPTARSATRTYIPKGLMYLKWSPFQPFVTHFCWFNISLPEALSFEKGCFLFFFAVIFSLCIFHWWVLKCVCDEAFKLGDRVPLFHHMAPGLLREITKWAVRAIAEAEGWVATGVSASHYGMPFAMKEDHIKIKNK